MQHDYNIGSGDSKTGLQVRQDINNALAAIKSSNSGAIAPTSPVVGMRWFNETNSISYEYTLAGWKAIANETSVNTIVAGASQPYVTAASNSAIAAAGSASSALSSATNAATSATQAQTAANLATGVVIPTAATYAIATQDWRDTMMSKAEFNAVAAERRANRAGSGFDEFGKYLISGGNINEGMWVPLTSSNLPNYLFLGRASGSGISKTDYPLPNINGVLSRIGSSATTVDSQASILLPPAPTVLPSTATLTQQQIDSGVIKHADASNSGLIVNGKFDTDTSGWTAINATLAAVSGEMVVTTTVSDGKAYQAVSTVIGKSYTLEVNMATSDAYANIWVGTSSTSQNLGASTTGTGKKIITFTATTTTSYIIVHGGLLGSTVTVDNIAVFPSDAISRSDLVFLESWHEDVSEKDFVYPLGNVQYLATTGDSGTPVAGAFAGAATYSLFSDTWQSDSALIGKGYVWSTLSDANKKAFVANPENNCYLDGDKVIQVRYRMRVVMGWGDIYTNPWDRLGYYIMLDNSANTSSSALVVAKGKKVSLTSEYKTYANRLSEGTYSLNTTNGYAGIGIIPDLSSVIQGYSEQNIAYEGKCFALPIALISR